MKTDLFFKYYSSYTQSAKRSLYYFVLYGKLEICFNSGLVFF